MQTGATTGKQRRSDRFKTSSHNLHQHSQAVYCSHGLLLRAIADRTSTWHRWWMREKKTRLKKFSLTLPAPYPTGWDVCKLIVHVCESGMATFKITHLQSSLNVSLQQSVLLFLTACRSVSVQQSPVSVTCWRQFELLTITGVPIAGWGQVPPHFTVNCRPWWWPRTDAGQLSDPGEPPWRPGCGWACSVEWCALTAEQCTSGNCWGQRLK